MVQLNRSSVRRGILAGILLVSVFLAETRIVAFVLLVLLFGLWSGVSRFLVPRSRFLGGIVILFLSLFTFLVAIPVNWVALVAGVLFAHGNWHALTAAARLDE